MERFIDDDSQRPGKLIRDRPMVCGDIHDIPFSDNSFSFIHCSHILEHLDSPEEAIAEMVRIARAGYIEVPSEIHEFTDLNFPFHRWVMSLEDGVLVFREKPENLPDHPLIKALTSGSNKTLKFIRKHHDNVNIISLFWNDYVQHRVERSERPIQFEYTDEQSSEGKFIGSRLKSKVKYLLGKSLSPRINLFDLLACPICKQPLKSKNSGLVCGNCLKWFPITDGVPMLTVDHAVPL